MSISFSYPGEVSKLVRWGLGEILGEVELFLILDVQGLLITTRASRTGKIPSRSLEPRPLGGVGGQRRSHSMTGNGEMPTANGSSCRHMEARIILTRAIDDDRIR